MAHRSLFPITLLAVLLSSCQVGRQAFNYLPRSTNAEVIHHRYYTLTYVERHEQAGWVAYELDDFMTQGGAERGNFRPDSSVVTGSALPDDYRGSGYDRGHLCPAADMKWQQEAMNETFLMSNMSPQRPGFNRGIWKVLEEQVRDWAVEKRRIYVAAGPLLEDGLPTIGELNFVSVPREFYKVILYYDGTRAEAIGFVLRNESSAEPLSSFVVTVDSVEALTGIDFFPELPDPIEESTCQNVKTGS